MVAKFQVSSYADEDKRDLLPSRGIEPDHPKINQLAKKITKNANTNYERTKLIYRYVAKNMNYDMQKFEQNSFKWNDSAIKSLQLKKGVCQDYVFLTLSLLRSLEIPSRFVEGVANGQNHAWVEAKVNGEWLIMDPTWGSGYIDPNRGFVKQYDGRFFDISSKRLERTHKRTGIVY
nr:transglutaminase-like domain-containing protein [Shimazuella alba]